MQPSGCGNFCMGHSRAVAQLTGTAISPTCPCAGFQDVQASLSEVEGSLSTTRATAYGSAARASIGTMVYNQPLGTLSESESLSSTSAGVAKADSTAGSGLPALGESQPSRGAGRGLRDQGWRWVGTRPACLIGSHSTRCALLPTAGVYGQFSVPVTVSRFMN